MRFNRQPQGYILFPDHRSRVQRHFRVEGTVKDLPPNRHLFLIAEIGGLMWPKSQVQVKGTSWSSMVYEGGALPHGRFTLLLYLTGDAGRDQIAAWLEQGKATGDYPGLERIRDGVRLCSVELRIES